MVLIVAFTLVCSVGIWATVAVSEFELFITLATAGAAVIAGALAYWRWVEASAITLTLSAALVPLWGFASEVQTTSPVVELMWLALAFFIGGIIIPGVFAFVVLAGIWTASTYFLLSNQAIPEAQAAEASVMLGFVCGATMVISYLGNRLEGHINANHRALDRIQRTIVSQNKELDLTLLHQQRMARQKEEFLASFSHELRTPLNAVLGLCEALQEEVYGPLTDKQKGSLETIESSGRHLLSLIVDILDVARIGAGKLMTTIQPCGISEIVAVLEHEFTPKAAAKNLTVDFESPSDSLTVQSDPIQVQRIISHLLANAIKFTPEGRRIGMRSGLCPCGTLVYMTVWDEGIGMSAEEIDELYRPLVQSDGGLSRQYAGLGLGLTLSTRLAHLIGASLLAESESEKGATFTLVLPLSGPRQVTLYGDLNCPFSYVLNEWFEEAGVSHFIDWQGVEHMPSLDAKTACTVSEQQALDEELERLRPRADATQVLLRRPESRPNTRAGLLALERIKGLYPEKFDTLRGQLFRALWRDGKDIGASEVIAELFPGLEVGPEQPSSEEVHALEKTTEAWRSTGHNRLPLAISNRTGTPYKGLGERLELTKFLREELGPSLMLGEDSKARDLTQYLREQHLIR